MARLNTCLHSLPEQRARGRVAGRRTASERRTSNEHQDDFVERMIADALAPVLADIRATGAPEPTVIAADWDPELQSTVLLLRADGSGQGVGILRRTSRANRVVQAADGVQEWVIETLWSERRPTNWPVCPAHPDTHPMSAVLLRTQPTWQCPELRGVHILIGSLQVL